MAACTRCGTANIARSRFCTECGNPFVTQPVSITSERRQLTVMFCDLVGSSALSARLDPEELREVLRAYQSATEDVVQRFGGTIVQYLGDGVLVYFGSPQAHEDDPRRAALAGLAIVRAMTSVNAQLDPEIEVKLAVRIGIHTGLAVVGAVGVGPNKEQLAVGETPNIAARLQGLAAPDTVVVSEITHRLLAGSLEVRELGSQTLAGFTHAMRVFQVVGEPETTRTKVTHAQSATMIGRESEHEVLLTAWKAATSGVRQIALVSGEAGIGKTRLLDTLSGEVTASGGRLLELRCSPFSQDSAFDSVVEMLSRWFDLKRDDDVATRSKHLRESVDTLALEDAAALPLLASLLRLPAPGLAALQLEAGRQRQRTLEVLQAAVHAYTSEGPVLLVAEDLHWVDPSTLEFLNQLVAKDHQDRLLVVLTYRPDFGARWSARANVTSVSLTGLTPPEAAGLVLSSSLGIPLPPEVVQQIVSRTDGVPLFIEETTRAIIDSGELVAVADKWELVGSMPATLVPMTLQDALMARLDRLGSAKSLARLGSAIGREFSLELLRAVAALNEETLQSDIDRLVASQLLERHVTGPHVTLVFRHSLMQETAYQSMLRATRRTLHQRIATVLQTSSSHLAEGRPEVLAHHLSEAGETLAAVRLWQDAGNLAISRAAFTEAISHLTRGLKELVTLPESPERDAIELGLQSALGAALQASRGYAADEVARAYARARELCASSGDATQLLTVLRGQWLFHGTRAEYHTEREIGEQILSIGELEDSADHRLEGHLAIAVGRLYLGELALSTDHFTQMKNVAEPITDTVRPHQFLMHSAAIAHAYLSRTLVMMGDIDGATRNAEEAVAMARRIAIPLAIAQTMGMHALLSHVLRDVPATLDWARRARGVAEEYGFPYWQSLMAITEAWALAKSGDTAHGIEAMERGVERYRATGAKLGLSWFYGALADLLRRDNRIDEAIRYIVDATAHIQATDERYYEAETERLRGELLLARWGRAAEVEAERHLVSAVQVAQRQGARTWELRASTSLAQLWHEMGRSDEAVSQLTSVLEHFAASVNIPDIADARAMLAAIQRPIVR